MFGSNSNRDIGGGGKDIHVLDGLFRSGDAVREARDECRSYNSSPRHRDVELSTPVIAGCLVGLQLELSYEVT